MSMKRNGPLKILVNLDLRFSAARDMLSGILRAVSPRNDVEVQFTGSTPSDDPLDYYAWSPDGFVTDSTFRHFPENNLTALFESPQGHT